MPIPWFWSADGATLRGGGVYDGSDGLREKRDQVLSFLEHELDSPPIASRVEEVVEPLLPEVTAACRSLSINLLSEDNEIGVTLVGSASALSPWDVVTKVRTEYLNAVNGIAFQNEQIGILVNDLNMLRDRLVVLKAQRSLAHEIHSLSADTRVSAHEPAPGHEFEDAIRQQLVSIAHAKLDLEDRLNKRRQKEQRRALLADGVLKKIIAPLQLAALASVELSTRTGHEHGSSTAGESSTEVSSNMVNSAWHQRSSTVRRRQKAYTHVYSDAEIKGLLKGSD